MYTYVYTYKANGVRAAVEERGPASKERISEGCKEEEEEEQEQEEKGEGEEEGKEATTKDADKQMQV